MSKTQCPLGVNCPYYNGRKIPVHKTENKTYWDHLEMSRKQQSTNMSMDDILEEFKNKGQLTPSQISDAKIRTDGTLTFMGIGKGKNRREASKLINENMEKEIKERMSKIAINKEELDKYIDFALTNYNFSSMNRVLIRAQKNSGTVFRTAAQWEEDGYQVRGNAISATVRRPYFTEKTRKDNNGKPVLDDNGEEIKDKFLSGYGFYGVYSERDLDETVKEPPKHPLVQHYDRWKNDNSLTASTAMKEDLNILAKELDIDVSYNNKNDSGLSNGASGYSTIRDGKYHIIIDNTMSEHAQVATYAHEMGHILSQHLSEDENRNYGNNYHRAEMEAEAEIFAYAFAKNYDVDNGEKTAVYLKSWNNEANPEQVRNAIDKAGKTIGTSQALIEKHITGTNQIEENSRLSKQVSQKYYKKKKNKK